MAAGDVSIRASFPCRVCGGIAATVRLVPPGVTTPPRTATEAPSPDAPYWRVVVEAGPLSIGIGGEVVAVAVERVRAALEAGDAAALYAADLEFAPFWCPRCAAAVCGEHWQTWLVFDEEDRSWLEEQRGICPEGHERMIFD